MLSLLQKAGYEVIFPPKMEKLCCGTIWESKGMLDIADSKSTELEAALWEASDRDVIRCFVTKVLAYTACVPLSKR